MAKTVAQKNRAIRQEALRQWLSEKCTAQHLVENIRKIEELDPIADSFTNELNQLKVANEQRLKVLSKYLPDLKSAEITGEGGGEVEAEFTITFKPVGNASN
jgi:predicted transcriptional regulator